MWKSIFLIVAKVVGGEYTIGGYRLILEAVDLYGRQSNDCPACLVCGRRHLCQVRLASVHVAVFCVSGCLCFWIIVCAANISKAKLKTELSSAVLKTPLVGRLTL